MYNFLVGISWYTSVSSLFLREIYLVLHFTAFLRFGILMAVSPTLMELKEINFPG